MKSKLADHGETSSSYPKIMRGSVSGRIWIMETEKRGVCIYDPDPNPHNPLTLGKSVEGLNFDSLEDYYGPAVLISN
jgi:hypothetical protein